MSECSGHCDSCAHKAEEDAEACRLKHVLEKIDKKIVVMSGKGGVGKSTVAVNLAIALAMQGKKTGLLDVDIHGPSIPKMLHLEGRSPDVVDGKAKPLDYAGLKVMSVGFLLENPDDAIIWRGPVKIGVIRQMFTEMDWGELDFLVVDCPPGTGDEPLSICQMLPGAESVIVTTPQQIAATDVAKSLDFCRQLQMPVLGIVENMSGFICPKCGEVTEIFSAGAGEELAERFHVPLLGKIPIDPQICRDGDAGKPFLRDAAAPTAKVFERLIEPLLN